MKKKIVFIILLFNLAVVQNCFSQRREDLPIEITIKEDTIYTEVYEFRNKKYDIKYIRLKIKIKNEGKKKYYIQKPNLNNFIPSIDFGVNPIWGTQSSRITDSKIDILHAKKSKKYFLNIPIYKTINDSIYFIYKGYIYNFFGLNKLKLADYKTNNINLYVNY